MIDDAIATTFSCPDIGPNIDVLDVVVSGHARQVTKEFIDRHKGHLDTESPGLRTALLDGTDEDETFDTTWDLAFGDLHAALLLDDRDPVLPAVNAGLRLCERGHPAHWRARLPAPTRLRFGPCLLPPTTELEVQADLGQVAITGDTDEGRQRTVFVADDTGWSTDGADALPILDPDGFHVTMSSADSLPGDAAARLLQADAYTFDSSDTRGDDDWKTTCEAAMHLIAGAAAPYVPWVTTVLRELVPLQARPGTFNSGSDRFSPGVVCLSDQRWRWPLAEMLVHEATHQYLHIANRLGPLDDGSDETLYYSPFRDKDRPIFYIVVAYHAFANVLLFYRTARANGYVPEPLAEVQGFTDREEVLGRQLTAIEPALRSATSLTPLGRALWEPLYTAIHEGDAR